MQNQFIAENFLGLEPAAQRVLRVYLARSAKSISVVMLAREASLPIQELQRLSAGSLSPWLDTTFVDEWDLQCDLDVLSSLIQRADDLKRAKSGAGGQISVLQSPAYNWQKEALAAWVHAGRQGIVEAVTGSGKTRVGLMAIEQAAGSKEPIYPLVVVPTIPIMNQWVGKIKEMFPGREVGRIGDGHNDDFSSPRTIVVVGVVNSLVINQANRLERLFHFCRHGRAKSLLVADECHHYLKGVVYSRLLRFPFDWTLGLSATTGVYEVQGLGRIIYEYDFKSAHADGLIPSFKIVNASVSLTRQEQSDYLALDSRIKDTFKAVLETYPSISTGDDFFWERLKGIMGKLGSGQEPLIERLFILMFRRAAIAYTAADKLTLGEHIVRHLVQDQRKKVMVFLERIESAEEIGDALDVQVAHRMSKRSVADVELKSWIYHSGLSKTERDTVLQEFRANGPSALFACRCLDEGIDLPDVDAAVLISSTQSQRQRIQRIGRILRRGDGTKQPIVVTLTVKGTSDYTITSSDHKQFEGVASIYETNGFHACLNTVKSLSVPLTS